MTQHTIFFDDHGIIRSGWRAAIFLVLYGILGIAVQAVVFAFTRSLDLEAIDVRLLTMIGLVVGSITTAAVAWLCGRLLEKLPLAALGASLTEGWLRHFLIGSALGVSAIAVALAPAVASGSLRFTVSDAPGGTLVNQLALSLIFFLAGAAYEELLFRGYVLQTFARSGLAWLAIVLTSVLFGAFHIANPSANWISTLNTMLAGVVFSVAYLRTLDLWLPLGLHFMWNFAQGSLFGIEVSGLRQYSPVSLLVESDKGPMWLTGEDYGIEASTGCTIGLLLVIVAIYAIPALRPDEYLVKLSQRERDITPPVS